MGLTDWTRRPYGSRKIGRFHSFPFLHCWTRQRRDQRFNVRLPVSPITWILLLEILLGRLGQKFEAHCRLDGSMSCPARQGMWW
jgi:hypothetical protein